MSDYKSLFKKCIKSGNNTFEFFEISSTIESDPFKTTINLLKASWKIT